MRLAYAPVMLKFKQPAGTSRGVLLEKPTYILKLWDERNPEVYGLGEASVFPGLSPEANGHYEYKIVELLANVALGRPTDLSRFSSLQLGFEEAIRDLTSGGRLRYFDSPFIHGEKSLTINGLVWMGNFDEMRRRVNDKLEQGFKCIKFKIGALDWTGELEMLKQVRADHSPAELEIRVDANGGFYPTDVMKKLEELAKLDIHSIEQPIKQGDWNNMALICKESPIHIALDEELIGIYTDEDRDRLLDKIHPHYIILKPTLCGAFSGSKSWIRKANEKGIGWWITSALESNIGLNAIAQFAAACNVTIPQGLGTGGLFVENFDTPIRLDGEKMTFDSNYTHEIDQISRLDWRE